MLYCGFYTSSSSLIAESEETLVFLFIYMCGIFMNLYMGGGEGCEFLVFILGADWAVPPPPHSLCCKQDRQILN